MASFKALCLAGVASLVATAAAHAADLLPPPPQPVYAAPPVVVPAASGWYLRGDVGAGINELSNAQSTFSSNVPNFSHDGYDLRESAILGLGAGYQVNNWFRADVTGEYRTPARYSAYENYTGSPNCPTPSGYACLDGYHGSVMNGVFLANGYVQLGTYYGVTPYVGAGVGVAVNQFSGVTDVGLTNPGAYGTAASHTDTHLAYAFMAGITYNLTPNVKLDVGYRYLDMGNITSGPINCTVNNGCPHEIQSYKLIANDIRLGVRYMFNEAVPYAPPVLVSKY